MDVAGGGDVGNGDGDNEDGWVVVVVVEPTMVSVRSFEGFGNMLVSGTLSGFLTSVAQPAPGAIDNTALFSVVSPFFPCLPALF